MKILVTGAAGFVGRHLMPILRAAYPRAELLSLACDITNDAAVAAEIADAHPDACIHLAAIAAIGEARSAPQTAWSVNVGGTLAIARAILAHAPSCRLVYASSADLYGSTFRAGIALDENALPAPINTYGATKAAADLALGAMAAEGLRVVRLRPFNHTGAGQLPNFAPPAFARQIMLIAAKQQEPVMKVGDLEPFRDFLDVRDVCAAYAACLRPELQLQPGLILNIASGTPRRIGDVLRDMLSIAKVDAVIETDTALLRRSDISLAIGDASAARRLLGWQPVISWTQTLTDLLEDWRCRIVAGER